VLGSARNLYASPFVSPVRFPGPKSVRVPVRFPVPGIFTESFQFFAPEEIDLEYTLGEGKLMVNVGSVGQPRDGDNRACYVVLEDGLPEGTPNGETDGPSVTRGAKIVYRRLSYDFETTIQKIYSVPELEPFLGDRLRQGR
jgi:diadenosine tetraphosphatase ApaH/serine/threonine PP2A family protein phosphatase